MTTKPQGAAVVSVSWSHGRPRTELRRPSDGGTPALPADEAAPFQDQKTGRFTDGKAAAARSAAKRKLLKEIRLQGQGIATLNPDACQPWLRPHVRDGAAYAMTLRERFPDPGLARLIGTTADAYVLYRALVALGGNGDAKSLTEARAWLKEHRACLRELAALGGMVKAAPVSDAAAARRARILEGGK